MGGPIDTRVNPTAVNSSPSSAASTGSAATSSPRCRSRNPGFMRDVYPGFLQLHGFVSMNLDRHIEAHRNLFQHLVEGDGDSAQKHREFYDEYLAVMDLAAEFYLQTVETVFIRHALPKGEMTHRGQPVDPGKIRRVALMTVEGEHDDISGVGQTEAAHELCPNIPDEPQGALAAARRRPLRRVQRLALPRRDRAAHRRFRAVEHDGTAAWRHVANRTRASIARPSMARQRSNRAAHQARTRRRRRAVAGLRTRRRAMRSCGPMAGEAACYRRVLRDSRTTLACRRIAGKLSDSCFRFATSR